MGSNEEATRLSGVNVANWKIAIYTLAGVFSGLGGVLIAARLNSAQPSLGQGYELDAIAAAVIGDTSLSGGEGSILGTVIGAFIISTLTNGLRIMSVPQEWQTVVTGAIVILAVYLDIVRRGQSGIEHTSAPYSALAALDSKAVVPLLEKAQAAKIPIVGFDSGVDSTNPVTTASTDNIAAAGAAADKMAEMIGNAGEVGLVVHDQTSRTGIDRRDGFVNQMKSKHPNVNIVDIQYGAGDQLKSTDIAKAMMQAHPNLKGFFGANEGSIIGVLNAVKELNKAGKLVVIGYDSGKQQTDAIRSGTEAGAITQDPIGIGYKCVDTAVKAIKGESLPKNIDTGYYWYDKTNIDDPKIKAVLYD